MENNKIQRLKNNYGVLSEKFNLPGYDLLNRDFSLEKLYRIETDFLIKEVRRLVWDKLLNYYRFIESLINLQGGSMFLFSLSKVLDENDKADLNNYYKDLSILQLKIIELDLNHSELSEANFILECLNFWERFNPKFSKLIVKMKSNFGNNSDTRKKDYFG